MDLGLPFYTPGAGPGSRVLESGRIATKTHRTLKQLSHSTDRTMQQVLEEALELYRRQTLLKQADAAYARLKADPEAHQAWKEELEEWDQALDDGLGDE